MTPEERKERRKDILVRVAVIIWAVAFLLQIAIVVFNMVMPQKTYHDWDDDSDYNYYEDSGSSYYHNEESDDSSSSGFGTSYSHSNSGSDMSDYNNADDYAEDHAEDLCRGVWLRRNRK